MGTAHIEFDAATKRYGRETALESLSVTVDSGQCVAVIGHNGAGKTTLMKLLLGLTRPSSGRVRLDGHDPAGGGADRLRRRLGYLPESVAFAGGARGRSILEFYCRLKREPAREVDRVLAQVGLAQAAERRVRTYSKGMRQRLGLAQAMLGSPTTLVLDEPTSGLDPVSRGELYACVDALRASGTTTLLASHSLAEIEHRSDRIAILREGRLIAFGTLAALRASARVPTRIRLRVATGTAARVAEHFGDGEHVQRVNGCHVHLHCAEVEKMAVLRRVTDAGEIVQDVDIAVPTLDELYRYYTDEACPS